VAAARSIPYGNGRQALLAATVRVVASRGLRGMTFRAVADEAGVNNSLIAHHFGTRDALLRAALEWSAHRSILTSHLHEYAVSGQAFRDALVTALLEEPELQVFQFEMILEASRRPELQPAIAELYDAYLTALTGPSRQLGLTRDLALERAMFAALDGLVLQYLARTITAAQLAESVHALGDAVARA
jgi:AcrR family transcriptional regulator